MIVFLETESKYKPIKDVTDHVYLGEYDDFGVIGKLFDKKVYVDSILNHTDKRKRSIQIYGKKRHMRIVFDSVYRLYHNELIMSEDVSSIGQGLHGFNMYYYDETVEEVLENLKQLYLHIKLLDSI